MLTFRLAWNMFSVLYRCMNSDCAMQCVAEVVVKVLPSAFTLLGRVFFAGPWPLLSMPIRWFVLCLQSKVVSRFPHSVGLGLSDMDGYTVVRVAYWQSGFRGHFNFLGNINFDQGRPKFQRTFWKTRPGGYSLEPKLKLNVIATSMPRIPVDPGKTAILLSLLTKILQEFQWNCSSELSTQVRLALAE